MANRPTDRWRASIAQEALEVAAGELDPECAGATELWPDLLLTPTDDALRAFEEDVRRLTDPSDQDVYGVIERVVLALNAVHDTEAERGHCGYETGEREQLCAYIDRTLTGHGVDVAALAARNGMGRHEITDRWRDW
ncbi:hypothetical protein [Streptomyces thermolilacinus]|uniref:Uncharacterized protein n=1 Tax=Streptomyces thermolilacinus SPC6 TaxID=1306406 RepID=A0A1D3DTB1_9ACTN|nr:hypothetical protein [Streptomyces thermolilacinus]OEJ95564.1 hypothetical protein J116_014840 [Streptomyces thermolilacinus SPC6]